MPIDRQEQQQPEITYTYTETTITQPIQPKQPNWENYVEGTQSSVFDQNRGLNSSVDQNSNPFSSSSTQQPTGYTSTNVGSQNLGKTDSDFHSSPRVNVAPSFIPSTDLGSNLDRDRSGSDLRSNQGSSSNQGSNFNSGSNNNNSSNDQDNTVSHMGSTGITTPRTNISSEPIAKPISQTFDPINVPFDPSIPQGIDAAADQRARGFYSGVDAKTNALGEIAGGKLLKGLNHVDRKSDSDLNRDSNSSNSNSNNDRDRSNDRDRTEDQSRSKDSHSGNTGAHDSNAQPHREGAYMPETTQHQEGDKSQDAHKEKKPFPERVADWVQNKMHPDKSGKTDDMEDRRNEVEDINNNNNTSSRGTDSSSNQGQQGQSGTTHHEQNGNNASAHQA